MQNQEFYIGWMAKAPAVLAKHTRKVLFILFAGAVIAGILLASKQKKFSSGNFEFGKLTTIKGVYYSNPVPMIKVSNGKDIFGNNSYTTILLLGYGKHGAETAIREMEEERRGSFNGRELELKGTLLYNDGKVLLQIDKNDHPVVSVGNPASIEPEINDLGEQVLKGEIIDPKCYFAVMKPGEGKVHKDCAIRCILGGIPPVLHVQNENGSNNYYLLLTGNGEKMNEAVKDYVAEPVAIRAHVKQVDDWVILYVKNISRIKR